MEDLLGSLSLYRHLLCVGTWGDSDWELLYLELPVYWAMGVYEGPPCWKGRKTLLGVKRLQEVCRPIWIETCFSSLCDLEQVWPLP